MIPNDNFVVPSSHCCQIYSSTYLKIIKDQHKKCSFIFDKILKALWDSQLKTIAVTNNILGFQWLWNEKYHYQQKFLLQVLEKINSLNSKYQKTRNCKEKKKKSKKEKEMRERPRHRHTTNNNHSIVLRTLQLKPERCPTTRYTS